MMANTLEEECARIEEMLSERLEAHDKNRMTAQERLEEICRGLEASIDELENRASNEIAEKSTAESERLQSILADLQMGGDGDDDGDTLKAVKRAKAELLVAQSYEFVNYNLEGDDEQTGKMMRAGGFGLHRNFNAFEDHDDFDYSPEPERKRARIARMDGDKDTFDLTSLCEVKTERKIVSEMIGGKKPTELVSSLTKKGDLSLSLTLFSEDEVDILKSANTPFGVEVKIWEKGREEGTSKTLTEKYTPGRDEAVCIKAALTTSTNYCLKARISCQEVSTQWSDEVELTPGFRECCAWKECLNYDHVYYVGIFEERKYSVDPMIATKMDRSDHWTVFTGSMPLPLNTVTSWSIRVLRSKRNDGSGIYVGVAPSDIDQNEDDNYEKYGWHFYCYSSMLCSGPPHNYNWPGKEYGPRKEYGKYVHTGDSVGVVMDTAKGELSFVLDGANLGVAYEGIPLDKPLVPCTILYHERDSVELVI